MGDDIIKITSKDLEPEPLRITADDLNAQSKPPPSSSNLIRVTADDIEPLVRQVGPPQVKSSPFSSTRFLLASGALVAFLLCGIATLIWFSQREISSVVSQKTRSETPSPALTLSSDSSPQIFTDKQFGYEITLPRSWSVKALNGSNDGIPGSPNWSALVANVEIESLQSLNQNTNFVLRIHQKPMASEEELLLNIVEQVIAQPGEILRREQGKVIEYRTIKPLLDPFGRPTVARWFWDSQNVLSFIASILDPNAPEIKYLDPALDSVRLLNP